MKNFMGFPVMANAPLLFWAQAARVAMESQMIIGIRVAGMMGVIPQSPGEPFRMVAEKQAAASESMFAMAQAFSKGAGVERAMSAGLRPYSKRTRANSKRLTRIK